MSAPNLPRAILEVTYADAAQEYLRGLTLEHHMEATAQGRQREITLESLALVKARRPEVQVFNELLVQYPRRGQKKPGRSTTSARLASAWRTVSTSGMHCARKRASVSFAHSSAGAWRKSLSPSNRSMVMSSRAPR